MNVALRPESLDVISLCTGGFGLDLALELAVPCARSVCLVEREAFSVAHLVSAMEQGLIHPAPVWSDARTFDGRPWRGSVDGVIGGIPCQPHSLAGRKQGGLDERDLWTDARRIIVQSGAWFVLIENVSGMLSAGADEIAGAERVWRDLQKLGFTVEGGLFTAAEVGASHERERLFILGVADHDRWRGRQGRGPGAPGHGPARRIPDGGDDGHVPDAAGQHALVDAAIVGRREGRAESGVRRGRCPAASADSAMGDAPSTGSHATPLAGAHCSDEGGRPRHAEFERRGSIFPPGPGDIAGWQAALERAPELEPAFRRMADGLAADVGSRVDELRMLGNGVVPLEGAYAIRTLGARLAGRGTPAATRLVRMMEGS